MGSNRRNQPKEHFARLTRELLLCDAWTALSCSAKALYPYLKLEWHGPKANNNGEIRLSVRDAAQRLGMGKDAASRAFQDLQAKGFLVVTEVANLGLHGEGKSHAYELTEHPRKGEKGAGAMLYRRWQKGRDFAVVGVSTNNPKGHNQYKTKTKPCPDNRDSNVLKIGTWKGKTS